MDGGGEQPPPAATRQQALRAAFHLIQEVQTPDADAARTRLRLAKGTAHNMGWDDVATVLVYAEAIDTLGSRPALAGAAAQRVVDEADRFGDVPMLAAGLGLRAELAVRSGDVVRHGADASRGVVLLDVESEPMARISGLISVACAYEALNLFELGDELYTRAEALLQDCDDPLLAAVIRINRTLAWFWWTAALLEVGDTDAIVHLPTTDEVAPVPGMPTAWVRELQVSILARKVLLGRQSDADRAQLDEMALLVDELDWLPRVQVHLARAHLALRDGDAEAAAAQVAPAQALIATHGTPYQRSFVWWTAALVEELRDPRAGATARTLVGHLTRQRWDERLGRLAAARDQISATRMRGEYDHLLRRTMEDPLTGLGNRRALEQCLAGLRVNLSDDHEIAMLIVDIDTFKRVNDVHGHETGDQVLRRVASILRSTLRTEDLALRLGGDEFAAVIIGARPEVVQQRADRIGQLVIAEPWHLVKPDLHVSVSVGAATAHGSAGLEGLYSRADAALYAAKRAGRGLLRIAR